MKRIAAMVAAALSFLPTLALACPASASHECAGSQLGQYASTFGIGLLFGVGSIAVESALKKRKEKK